jgi:glycine/D-amino acid oxidase-like deaminating enzyme
MDLRTANPYWLLKDGIAFVYPSLKKNIKKDVVVIGSGISGSLVAWYLYHAGIDVAIVDRRHTGMGSTVASTGLLQYEIDTPLHELVNYVGEQNAVTSYKLCQKAIYDLQDICKKLRSKSEFELTPSFQYASFKKHVDPLRKEYELRKQYDFEVEWLNEKDIKKLYGFSAPAGIFSATGAQVNAYGLTNELLHYLHKKDVAIYDHTSVIDIQYQPRSVTLKTSEGHTITCKKLVIACGYESQRYIPFKVCDLNSTYAIVSEPLEERVPWYRQSMIWETAEPYSYVRTTKDCRVLIGGKDDPWSNPNKRDAQLSKKAAALEKQFQSLFPKIPFYTDFTWAGTFASTKDGLPFIGSIPQRPHTWFALGFGGNGITFSVVAAAILRDLLAGKKNAYAPVFQFGR